MVAPAVVVRIIRLISCEVLRDMAVGRPATKVVSCTDTPSGRKGKSFPFGPKKDRVARAVSPR